MTFENDLVPADVQQLLQLFSSLPDVRFPELEPATLHDAVARLQELHLERLHIEAQLTAVQNQLEEEQEALLKKSHRLLSYLKVFAEQDDALILKVNALSLPRLKKAPVAPKPAGDAPVDADAEAPKKRGRPRKVSATDALFASEPAEVAA